MWGTASKATARNLLAAVVVIVAFVGVVQLFAGALAVSVNTDEPTHVSRAQSWIDTGWYIPAEQMDGSEPLDLPTVARYVYGPAFSSIAHAVNVVAGNESAGEVSYLADASLTRHVLVALLALATAAAVGLGVLALTGSRLFALWAGVALLAIPLWMGQGFFNIKDTPAAAGYTFVTVALVIALSRAGKGESSMRFAVAIGAMVGFGVLIGAGTRLAFWVPLIGAVAIYGLLVFAQQRFAGVSPDRKLVRAIVIGAAAGLVAIVVLYPTAFANPFDALWGSVSQSSEYPNRSLTLTAGRLLTASPPAWYLPVWVFASLPLIILGLALTGAGSGAWRIVRAGAPDRGRDRLRAALTSRELPLVLVLMQALLLSLGAIVLGSVMYSGLRQHLYLVPPVAMLAGYGAWLVWQRARGSSRGPWVRRAAAFVLGLALVVPMAEQTGLYPFNYAYVNPVAGIGGINDRWETDYWWASLREGIAALPEDAEPLCSGALVTAGGRDERAGECSVLYYGIFADERGSDPPAGTAAPGEVWVLGRKRAGNRPPDYCRTAEEVTRWLRGEDVVMSYVLLCDRAQLEAPSAASSSETTAP